MKQLAAQIREQLRRQPSRQKFSKLRHVLLEIAVALECANAALLASEQRIRELEIQLMKEKLK